MKYITITSTSNDLQITLQKSQLKMIVSKRNNLDEFDIKLMCCMDQNGHLFYNIIFNAEDLKSFVLRNHENETRVI